MALAPPLNDAGTRPPAGNGACTHPHRPIVQRRRYRFRSVAYLVRTVTCPDCGQTLARTSRVA